MKSVSTYKVSKNALSNHVMNDNEFSALCKTPKKLEIYLKYLHYASLSQRNNLIVQAFKKSEGYCPITITYLSKFSQTNHHFLESENFIFIPIKNKLEHAMLTKIFHNCTIQSYSNTKKGHEKRMAVICKTTNKIIAITTIFLKLTQECYLISGYRSNNVVQPEINNFLLNNQFISEKALLIENFSMFRELGGNGFSPFDDDFLALSR